MKESHKKDLYRKCDPYKSFEPNSEINIDIDNYYNDCSMIRGYCWAKKLFKKISYGDGSTYQLFTGYTGSGKTTELKRIVKMAKEDNYLVVYINADDFIAANTPMDISDIYNTIVYNTIIEVDKLLGKSTNFEDEGFFHKLNIFLQQKVSLKKIKSKNFVLEVKETKTFRDHVRQAISDNFAKYKKDVREELYKLNEKVKDTGKSGIIVILDSLEKHKGITSNYEEVIKAAEIVFSNRDNLVLPLDVIYTVPAFLSERVKGIYFLPAIKVKTNADESFKKGIDLLKELVYYRVSREDLKEILGDNYNDKLEKIISFSGGYPRDLLQIMRNIILEDNYPVKDKTIDKTLQNERNTYSELISVDLVEKLKIVKETKSIKSIKSIDIKDIMLNNHLILRYRNDSLWFDVHPAVESMLD